MTWQESNSKPGRSPPFWYPPKAAATPTPAAFSNRFPARVLLVDPDGRSKRIPEIGWTLLVIQRRTAKQSAFLNRLAQNLIAAVLISLILVSLAQLSLGREHRRLETRAQTDMLSGVMNRSVFEPLVAQLAAQMQGRQEPLAVALMDLDTG